MLALLTTTTLEHRTYCLLAAFRGLCAALQPFGGVRGHTFKKVKQCERNVSNQVPDCIFSQVRRFQTWFNHVCMYLEDVISASIFWSGFSHWNGRSRTAGRTLVFRLGVVCVEISAKKGKKTAPRCYDEIVSAACARAQTLVRHSTFSSLSCEWVRHAT